MNLAKIYEKYMLLMGVAGQSLFYIQGFKIYYNQSASDVSFTAFLLGLISVSSWLVYGVIIKNRVLVIANAFAVVGAILVLSGILIHGSS